MHLRPTVLLLAAVLPAMPVLSDPPASAPAPVTVNFTISRETTYVTAPLRPDRTVDYLGYLNAEYGKGVTAENNAAIPLLQAFGPHLLGPPERLSRVLAALNMPPLPADGPYYVPAEDYSEMVSLRKDPERAREIEKLLIDQETYCQKPWEAKDSPALAAYIQWNRPALDLLVRAGKRPRFFIPLVSAQAPPRVSGAGRYSGVRLLSASQTLGARALFRMRAGDLQGAMDDLLSLHRLGAAVSRGTTLIDMLIGAAVRKNARIAAIPLLTSGKLPAPQASEYLAALTALPDPFDVRPSFTYQRLSSLDDAIAFVSGTAEKPESPYDRLHDEWAAVRKATPDAARILDWNVALKAINQRYDKVEAYMANPTLAAAIEFNKEPARIRAQVWAERDIRLRNPLQAREQVSAAWAKALASMVAVDYFSFRLVDTLRAREETLRVAAMLALWRAEKGAYPKALADLVPALAKAVPLDPCSGKPLVYRTEGAGYTLYSVGGNCQDDGGKNDPKRKLDDIVIRAE